MKSGTARTQINECWDILKKLRMDGEFIPHPPYPSSPRAFFKGLVYRDVWRKCLQNRFYHFQLHDNSLIYFGESVEGLPSLSYYEFPYAAMTYLQYLNHYDIDYNEAGEEFREEYDDYLTTFNLKESITNIRYDLSYLEYVEGRHPASHMHIGYNSNIRICTEKIMGPLAFLMFVLRQHYPEYWVKYTGSKQKQTLRNAVREKLDTVHSKYLRDLDRCELFLG